jgi:hypothetical protein
LPELGIKVVGLPLKILDSNNFATRNGLLMQTMYISTLNMEYGQIGDKLEGDKLVIWYV